VTGTLKFTNALASATIGAAYSSALTVSGGTPPYAWSLVRDRPGTLAWSSVNEWAISSSGVVTSIVAPTAAETAQLVLQVTDTAKNSAQGTFPLVVTGLAIKNPMALGPTQVNTAFSATMTAAGGSGSYSWALASQTGKNVWSVTSAGVVFGTPTAIETDTLMIKLTDTKTDKSVTMAFYISVVQALAATRPAGNTGSGLFVRYGELYDATGKLLRLRGINRAHYDANPQPGFAKTGANCARMFMYTVDGSISAAEYASVATSEHISAGSIPIITMAQFPSKTATTGNGSTTDLASGVAWWTANYSAFASIQKSMILNIANEWGPSNSVTWSNAYQTSIASLRAAGYTCPLLIDTGGSGQDINDLVNYSQAVFNSDPQKNVIFAFHFYGLSLGAPYSTVADLESICGKLATLKSSVGAAYAITEFGPGYAIGPSPTNVSPGQVVTAAEAAGLGTIAWAWDDNDENSGESDNNTFSFKYAGGYAVPSDLTIFGQDMVLNPYYGIAANAKPASGL